VGIDLSTPLLHPTGRDVGTGASTTIDLLHGV